MAHLSWASQINASYLAASKLASSDLGLKLRMNGVSGLARRSPGFGIWVRDLGIRATPQQSGKVMLWGRFCKNKDTFRDP